MAAAGLRSITFGRVRKPKKIQTLVILFVLLTTGVAGVASVLTSPDWGSLWSGLIFGLLFGWLLAIFQVPAWISLLVITTLGTSYALAYAGGLRYKFSILLGEVIFSLRQFNVNTPGLGIDFTSIQQSLTEIFNSTGVILERIYVWSLALATGEPTFDPVAVTFVWIAMIWIVAAWAGWVAIAYRKALFAVLPALLLSVGTLSYSQRTSFSLYLMLGLTLLLLATIQQEKREQEWDDKDTAFPPRKGRQVGYTAILISVAVVLLSAALSSISIPRILEWVSAGGNSAAQVEGGLAESLGIVTGATATPDLFDNVRNPGLPREKLIGSGPELSKRIVMTVAVEDFPSVFKGNQAQPLYWRSFTYDKYTGRGWRTSDTTLNRYDANQLLQPEQVPQHVLIEQTVRPVSSESQVVYTAGEPVTVNHSSDATWRSPEDLFGILVDHSGSFEARSLISIADEQTLQSAGQSYPDWVNKRFLNLPSELPSRVKELALQLTASEPTPYDRVRAIERYLRTIPYTLDVPYPPLDKDLVDFFLFDLHKGYCDYYASALVVMARAAGVPARFVIGYASGTYDLNSKRFLVSEADAHSWVEVYFPNVGWVPFEPTAGRPALERSPHFAASDDEITILPVETLDKVQSDLTFPGWLLTFGFLTLIGVVSFAWIILDEMRLQNLTERAAAVAIFQRLKRYGSYLEVTTHPGDTPHEFEELLHAKIDELSKVGLTPVFETCLLEEISTIADRIVETSYRPNRDSDSSEKLIFHQWKRLRWRLRLVWLVNHSLSLRDRILTILAGGSSDYIVDNGNKE